jgi:hypothetical protein
MPIDLETLSTGQLENLIANHRRKRATDAPLMLLRFANWKSAKERGSISINRYPSYWMLPKSGVFLVT